MGKTHSNYIIYIYYYIYNLNDEEMDVETWGLSGSNPLVFQVFTL
jgi:hypothetical protein